MKIRYVLTFVLLFVFGCQTHQETTSLDNLLFNLRRSFVIANDRAFLEEFIKYETFGSHYFSLYRIGEVTLTANVINSQTMGYSSKINLSKPPNIQVSGNSSTVSTEGGTTVIKFEPYILNAKRNDYFYARERFNCYKNKIQYQIFYPSPDFRKEATQSSIKSTNPEEKLCRETIYCVPVDGLTKNDRKAWAYLLPKNIAKFKSLEESFTEDFKYVAQKECPSKYLKSH